MSVQSVDYELILKQSPNGIVFTDNSYMIRYFNDAAERLTGVKKDNAVDRSFFDVFPQMEPYRGTLDEDRINRIIVNDKNICVRNFENLDKTGAHSNRVFIMHDYYEDLSLATELERTEQVMQELQEIIEGSFDGILVTDGEANVLLVNQSYVRNTAIKKEELIGHNMKELINPIWMKNSVALLAIEQRQPVSLHHTTQHGKNIMVTGTPIFDKSGNIKKVVINSRDISEIYELREELSKAKEMERIYFEQISDDDDDEQNPGRKDDIVVVDAKMRETFSLARKISNFNTTVLITGESGVGKEVVAHYIHDQNALKKGMPFVAVNCGAIPENLLESELFGYVEGAFTGAAKGGKAGLFEAANGGTLFLDEVGEMSLNLQVKLLRALETHTVIRLGSSAAVPVDIRVIAATNKNLMEKVEDGSFRGDLYYRLNVVSIEIPPLRERPADIAPLALKFINKFNRQYGQNKKFTYEVMKELESYPWPGSIRQLKNVIENMVLVSNNEYLQLNDLPWFTGAPASAVKKRDEGISLQEALDNLEFQILKNAKSKYGSSRKMAEALKVDQSTIIRKLKKYQL